MDAAGKLQCIFFSYHVKNGTVFMALLLIKKIIIKKNLGVFHMNVLVTREENFYLTEPVDSTVYPRQLAVGTHSR